MRTMSTHQIDAPIALGSVRLDITFRLDGENLFYVARWKNLSFYFTLFNLNNIADSQFSAQIRRYGTTEDWSSFPPTVNPPTLTNG